MNYLSCFLLLMLVHIAAATESVEHNIIKCEIYDMNKKLIRRFPGNMCIFLDDGSFVSAETEDIVYYDNKRNEVWRKKIYPHHQLNLSLDKKTILAIGSLTKKISVSEKNENIRSDVLYTMNLSGEILKTFDFYESSAQFDKKNWSEAMQRKFVVPRLKEESNIDWEVTHTNSFYEIPPNLISNKLSPFKSGNYIVNDISLMLVFILDADLKKILWQNQIINENWTMLHDVQVIPNSNLLLFFDNGTPDRPQSRLVEYNVLKNKIHWQFPKKLTPTFYCRKMCGVQMLKNGNYLYNDITEKPKAVEIKKTGTEIWSLYPLRQYEPFQQAKRADLRLFLKNHRGL